MELEVQHSRLVSLEIPTELRRTLTQKITNFAEKRMQKIEEGRLPCFAMKADRAAGLLAFPIEDGPKDIDTLLEIFEEHVLGSGIQHSHGSHIAFVPGGGIYAAALGDYLAAVTNCYVGESRACPGAVRMENMLISWVAGLFDFPPGSAGSLTSGGSMATVLALATAIHSKQLKPVDFNRSVVYTTEATHYCLQKAQHTIGLWETIMRRVPMDNDFRMDPKELRRMITHDQEAGLLPFMISATLGTTDVGAVDPIDEIADVAEEYDLWFHVDAAYGGFFVLLEEFKHLFKGVHRVDSLIVDPHKGLFLPFGSGMVIVREGWKLRNANTITEGGICEQDDNLKMNETSPKDLSFETSKHFRGLRMWLPLQMHGVGAFRECLREKVRLARYVYEKLLEMPGLVIGRCSQLTAVTFHYETGNDEENERVNQELLTKMLADGSVHMASTRILGKFCLRICVLHFRCHKDAIDLFLSILQRKIIECNASTACIAKGQTGSEIKEQVGEPGPRTFELCPGGRRTLTDKITIFAEEHLNKVAEKRIPCFSRKSDSEDGLLEFPIEESPKDLDNILAVYEECVLGSGILQGHGGQLGFMAGGGVYPAALGDYLAAVTNRYAGSFYGCPGAVRMENMLISWVANLFDFPVGFAGNLTPGCSVATALAILTARHSKELKGQDYGRTVVYTTDTGNAYLHKSMNVIGFFDATVRHVPMDKMHRMDPDQLRNMIRKDKEAGLLPFMISATIGTTDVGAVDPIDEIADVAEEYDLWFHVDAAYGGFFVLLEEFKHLFKGVHRVDSLIVDPQIGLCLPFGIGILVVKDGYKLRNANTAHDPGMYIEVHKRYQDEESPKDLSFELTRHFRGLRMWLPLQLYGVTPFRENLLEKTRLAQDLHSRLAALPGFVVGSFPQLTVVTFHYETGNEETNEEVNRGLLDKILQDGSIYISSIRICGKFRLRICLMHFRCHAETIDLFLAILQIKAKELKLRS
ncbi:uncharacterized protein [Ptychodera flava]|uniref:uncharacterized protein n=1 Tax=Ptychodera flava TaxID=63121 RepID=UPI00396A4561